MVGPRPIPYDVPLMSTAWSVLALSLALEGPVWNTEGGRRDV
jgi:hypothetical protein